MSATLKSLETIDKRVTSWLPLTTAWNLPPGCSTNFHTNAAALIAFHPGYGLEGDQLVRCVPPEIVSSWKQAALGHPDTSISLGPLTCPDYLYTGGISVKDGSSTLATCCPSGYVHENAIPDTKLNVDCLSIATSNMVLTFRSTAPGDLRAWTMVTTTLTTSSTVRAMAVMGWNIETSISVTTSTSVAATATVTSVNTLSMNVLPKDSSAMIVNSSLISTRSEDSPVLASSSAIGLSSTISAAPSSTISRSITDYGLSAEDKAGIGVGAGVVAIGLGVLVVAICILVRKQRRSLMRRPPHPNSSRQGTTWNAPNQNSSSRTVHEPSAPKVSSLPARNASSTCSSPSKPIGEPRVIISESQQQPGRLE
ncbi:hypothetical protein BDV33DRAFT_198444 [Aspergillus novoparasiticus]|uniref:Mid2 domain-containing protein n=1 Tax=Aspergillus novoparasiticus TaxID=986946 RepID=A0A5N6F6L8_9EURO|nr:hypothetical protein BDV33DRAFT_198444 [Aspergillus novoparasiticus]